MEVRKCVCVCVWSTNIYTSSYTHIYIHKYIHTYLEPSPRIRIQVDLRDRLNAPRTFHTTAPIGCLLLLLFTDKLRQSLDGRGQGQCGKERSDAANEHGCCSVCVCVCMCVCVWLEESGAGLWVGGGYEPAAEMRCKVEKGMTAGRAHRR